jgi:hypothetical protein
LHYRFVSRGGDVMRAAGFWFEVDTQSRQKTPTALLAAGAC